MSSTTPCPKMVVAYRWPDGWCVARVLDLMEWIDIVRSLWDRFCVTRSTPVWRKSLLGMKEAWDNIAKWDTDQPLPSLSQRAIVGFVLLDPTGTPQVAMSFAWHLQTQLRQDNTPTLYQVFSTSPRVENLAVRAHVVDWLYHDVYAGEAYPHTYMFSFYELGLPEPVEDDQAAWFEAGPHRSGFDDALRVYLINPEAPFAYSGLLHALNEYVEQDTGKAVARKRAFFQHYSSPYSGFRGNAFLKIHEAFSPGASIAKFWKFCYESGPSTHRVVLAFQVMDDGSTRWTLWPLNPDGFPELFDDMSKPPFVAQEPRQIFLDAGILAGRADYWRMVDDLCNTIPEGEPAIDVEMYHLLDQLPPIYLRPKELCALVGELGLEAVEAS
jgi:hypothetical protein